MKEFKGTPGPWKVGRESSNSQKVHISGDGWSNFARIYAFATFYDSGELDKEMAIRGKANISLILAAPDLLFALQEITAHLDSIKQYSNDDYYINQAQLAITKALGE